MARLGDYVKQIRGVSYKPEDLDSSLNENSIILLRANNIQDGRICLDNVVYVNNHNVFVIERRWHVCQVLAS